MFLTVHLLRRFFFICTAQSSTAPSVDLIWFPSSPSYDHAVPVQCVVKGVVPSQVKVFWTTGGRRERGQAVCLRAGGEVFTVSQRLWSEECERGEECTCVVEHEGQTITRTLEPRGSHLITSFFKKCLKMF